MELAERIEEKRPSVVKSDTLGSGLTVDSTSQLHGNNIKPFVIVTIFGMFILLGGSLLILYQNFTGANEEVVNGNFETTQEIGHKPISSSNQPFVSRKIGMIISFTLIGVGVTLVAIGSVITIIYCLRFRLSGDSERSPILDKNSGDNLKAFESSSTMKGHSKRRKNKKRTASWMKNTTRSLSREGFRFAAHRHPSVNPISIDGSPFFFRRLSEHSTSSSSEEKPSNMKGSASTKATISDFLRKIFKWNKSYDQVDKFEMERDREDSSVHENDYSFLSARNSEDYTDNGRLHNAGGPDLTNTHSGLYNLEQE